jgi:AcrR family transcriptional regulator
MNGVIVLENLTLTELKKHDRERRREIVLAAAQELFSKRGVSGVNMRDVARRAGVSVGFIYRYFSGRTDIFVELFEAGVGEILERIDAEVEREDPRPLRSLARTYVDFLHENMMFFQMMSHFMLEGKLSDRAVDRVNNVLRQILNRVETVFSKEGGGGNSRILAHGFFAALNGVMISLVNYPGRTRQEIRSRTLLLAETIADQFEHTVEDR